MKKRIMITTFQNAYNYGAILQCFALQDKIQSLGYNVEVLNYLNTNIGNQYKPFYVSNPKHGRKDSIKSFLSSSAHYFKRKKRKDVFEEFLSNNINLTKKYTQSDIKKLDFSDCILITGSDQVWNPNITRGFDDIYTLNFGKDFKKVSYAASLGNTELIEKYKKEYISILDNINNISVREDDSREKLSELTKRKIESVLDPTLLLERNKWDLKLENVENIKEKYICAYVVEPDDEYIKIVNDLSEKSKLPVIHFGVKNPGYKNVIKSVYTSDPFDFINTIKNAEYVVTTSYHATIFSIIYNKKFFVIPHRQTGIRVVNLLHKLGIKERIYNTFEEFKNIDYNIESDWKIVQENLDIEKNKSINWLKEALEK